MSQTRGTKVARCIDAYDIPEMSAILAARWTGESGERLSLRDLATLFNTTLIDAALREAGTPPLSIDVAGIYDLLRDGTSTEQLRARRRLEREGVDAETLVEDFVSHTAIHTYLTADRGVSLPARPAAAVEDRIETIEKLEGRVAAVTNNAVSALPAPADADDPAYEVLVDVKTVCTACGETYPVRTLLHRGGCRCVDDDA